MRTNRRGVRIGWGWFADSGHEIRGKRWRLPFLGGEDGLKVVLKKIE